MKAANIPINNECMQQFQNVICRSETNSYEIMKPTDFDVLVLPGKPDEEPPKQNPNINSMLLVP
jgi:hypothetical protein